jgi:hypothetical protein
MVVVDNARRMIGKNADISVTSVLQTTAGKMIFGRLNEESVENGHNTNLDNRSNGSGLKKSWRDPRSLPTSARHPDITEPTVD